MSDDHDSLRLSRRRLLQGMAAALAGSQATLPLGAAVAAAEPMAAAPPTLTVAQYILRRLAERGVHVLFGVPGATCDPLFAATVGSQISAVITASDLEAGYAADGYARVRGLGAVSVTYGVGTMSLLAPISGAFAERSPVVVINGGPSAEDLSIQRELGVGFSHSNGRERSDLTVFAEVTGLAVRIEHASTAAQTVDHALVFALTHHRPVYLEVPKDLWNAHCPGPRAPLEFSIPPVGTEEALAQRIAETLNHAARPVLLLGVELQRQGLTDAATALVSKLGIPWATTLLGKSVIPEQTPGFIGVYSGEHAVPGVRQAVEGSDALLALGCVMGRQYRHLVTTRASTLVRAADGELRFGKERAIQAALGPLLDQLNAQTWNAHPDQPKDARLAGLTFEQRRASLPAQRTQPSAEAGCTYDGVLSTVSGFLDDSHVVLTDTSLSMYPAAELNVSGRGAFICNAVWQSIGYSVAAAVGVGLGQARRPLVLCGDGGFQMTAQSLSTLAAHQVRAIILVLDNGHYGIEQYLLDARFFASPTASPRPYLELSRWNYVELARALGVPLARTANSTAELLQALTEARAATGPVLIAVTIKRHDLPSELKPS